MKKKLLISLCVSLISLSLSARHIKGGELFYQYLGPGTAPNTDKFRITLRLFINCQSVQGQLETEVYIGIYRNGNESPVSGSPFYTPLTESRMISLTKPSPCIVNPSPVCYWLRIFSTIIEIPKDPLGYTAIFQRCCRIDGISNLAPNNNIGASYTCQIHGTNTIGVNGVNSNPQFLVKDTVLICQKRPFTLDFGATDADNDSLSYEFAPGYLGGSTTNPVVTDPPPPSDVSGLGYRTGFSGMKPLGSGVTIDPKTGVISGIAPTAGDYVVCVLLKEWRNGVVVTAHRKDFIIHIDDKCDFASADLKPSYISCDGFTFSFNNEAPASPLIHSYFWDFGIAGRADDTANTASPSFTFPNAGEYTVKLYVNKGEQCSDSATTLMKVYPGFFPGFTVSGSCLFLPLQFTDTTKTRYGQVSAWSWDFGDLSSQADTSHLQNPSWKYSDTGTKRVQLIVSSSLGCMDTVSQDVPVLSKPPIELPFRDTLICDIDTLQLHARGIGNFSWTPSSPLVMLNANTPDPLVFPKTTTIYTVTLDQNGCVNSDQVQVRVVDHVTLYAGNDTTICLTDTITLNPSGDGLYFKWSPAGSLDNPNIKNPQAFPGGATTYSVVASIGKCTAQDALNVNTVPYPGSFAGSDTSICYDDTAHLNASIKGIRFNWTPTENLSNPSILDPLAYPSSTTTYSLYVYDTIGCPKPGISRVTVHVEDKINAFAGNDTSIVVGQPLQLSGSGAPYYSWDPPDNLNQNDIPNPIATLSENATYVMKAYTEVGCYALDTINIKVFKTLPDIFVPNAFTPGRATNNVFRPIPVGISSLQFFRIYNRNGMLIFSTSQIGKGWDGTYAGKPQDIGGYVWMVKGTDYTGKIITKKGTMVLVR